MSSFGIQRTYSYILANDGSVYFGYSSGLGFSVLYGPSKRLLLNKFKYLVLSDSFQYDSLWSFYLDLIQEESIVSQDISDSSLDSSLDTDFHFETPFSYFDTDLISGTYESDPEDSGTLVNSTFDYRSELLALINSSK